MANVEEITLQHFALSESLKLHVFCQGWFEVVFKESSTSVFIEGFVPALVVHTANVKDDQGSHTWRFFVELQISEVMPHAKAGFTEKKLTLLQCRGHSEPVFTSMMIFDQSDTSKSGLPEHICVEESDLIDYCQLEGVIGFERRLQLYKEALKIEPKERSDWWLIHDKSYFKGTFKQHKVGQFDAIVKSELAEILDEVIEEFWSEGAKPKNEVIRAWLRSESYRTVISPKLSENEIDSIIKIARPRRFK